MLHKKRYLILILGDIFFAYISLLLTIAFGFWKNFDWEIIFLHLFPFSILYLLWLLLFYIFDLYNLNIARKKLLFYPRLFGALGTGGILGTILFYLVPIFGITPKTNLVLNILFFGILILFWRKFFYSLFSYKLLNNVAILGLNSISKSLAQEIITRPYLGYKLKSIYRLKAKPSLSINGVKISIIKNNLLDKIKKEKIDLLIIADNLRTNSSLMKSMYECLPTKINFLDLSRAYETICQKIPISFINYGWFLENLKEGEKTLFDRLKRIFDIVFAFLGLIITSPLFPLIAISIKLGDKGPVFYKQKRVGKNRKPFLIIKFRSMKQGAEKETGPVFAKKEDSRITKVGGFLRITHLDEIPQLINVLKGEISLVGPRPERANFVEELEKKIPHYHLRHLIKPGVTGWGQIKFRYARDTFDHFEKFQHDLYYLKNRSFLLDIGIILKTFRMFFKKP